jgi:hypothetical protein
VELLAATIALGDSVADADQVTWAMVNNGANTMTVKSGDTFAINMGLNTAISFPSTTAITMVQPTTFSQAIVLGSPQTIACGTGGALNVAAAPTAGIIVTSGTLSSNCTINFATNAASGLFTIDMSGVTLGATFGVVFANGSATKTYLSSSVLSGTLATVWTHGTNTLAVNF